MKKWSLIFVIMAALLAFTGCSKEEEEVMGKVAYVTIECSEAVNYLDYMKDPSLVPENGYIMEKTEVALQEGDTAFDVLSRAVKDAGIHMEHETTPGTGGAYVAGIANIYEGDCESFYSGWGYKVNGESPSVPCSELEVEVGDEVLFSYLVIPADEMYEAMPEE